MSNRPHDAFRSSEHRRPPPIFWRRSMDAISALNVGVFRGGCLTGPNHSGVQLHGFLSYLVKVALADETYTVFGYKGKQVRDNIHSFDVVRAAEEFFAESPAGRSVQYWRRQREQHFGSRSLRSHSADPAQE